jgi:urease accessory protein
LILIRELPAGEYAGLPRVPLHADRFQLAKKRWRGRAADGQEFGFELETALGHGVLFHANDRAAYVIEQAREGVLALALPSDAAAAAEMGWKLGNLHVPIQVERDAVFVADEPGMRQNLERQHLAFQAREAVFTPLRAGHGHFPHEHASPHGHTHSHGGH